MVALQRIRRLATAIAPPGRVGTIHTCTDTATRGAAGGPYDAERIDIGAPGSAPSQTDRERRSPGNSIMSGFFRASLEDKPRLDLEFTAPLQLLRRAQALGASEVQINACLLAGGDITGALKALVTSLEPPPPGSVTVADLSVERTASPEEMVSKLHEYGAVVIRHAAEESLIAQIDAELEPWGAWSADATDRAPGSQEGRMGMDGLLRAPSTEHLLTNPVVLSAVNALLGPHCRRIALKEIEIFAVQPGQGKQLFHHEDQFWPWHHEPHPWAVSVLWAIDDFTPENGGTRILPCSHKARHREGGRELMEGTYDEADVLKVAMPRGSVLIFVGGMMHAGGTNTTTTKRKSFLTGYQLGWLRPENK